MTAEQIVKMSRKKRVYRERLSFVPEWSGPIERWVLKQVNKQLYRLKPFFDEDDIYQEGYLIFLVLKERYTEVANPAHFMSLFTVSFFNRINTLAKKQIPLVDMIIEGSDDQRDVLAECTPDLAHMVEVEARLLIADAPKEIQALIRGFDDPRYQAQLRQLASIRETTNEFLCRVAGIDCDMRALLDCWYRKLRGIKQKREHLKIERQRLNQWQLTTMQKPS